MKDINKMPVRKLRQHVKELLKMIHSLQEQLKKKS